MEFSAKMYLIRNAILFNLFVYKPMQAYTVGRDKGELPSSFKKLNTVSCSSCNQDLDSIRSHYHLNRIKERIQAVLGIDSDGPFLNQTKLSDSVMSRVEALLMEQKNEDVPESIAERQILLAETGGSNAERRQQRLKFKLPLDARIAGSTISLAELWIPEPFKQKTFSLKLRIELKNKAFQTLTKSIAKEKLSAFKKPDGWVALSLTEEIRYYAKNEVPKIFGVFGARLVLELSYQPEHFSQSDKNLQPFFTLEAARIKRGRKRRGVECFKGKASVCCREKLTVRFADIGLQDHIIEPRQFEAYQCVGTCGSFSRSASPRVEIVKSVISSMRQRNVNTDHIKFCCSAARSSPQKLLYFSNDKKKILTKKVDGLIVDECDCL